MAQVHAVADGVARRHGRRRISDPAEVHFVQIKCPLLTAERIGEAMARGRDTAVKDTLKSMAFSRGAAALGVGVALGEIAPELLSDGVIGRDPTLWSGAPPHRQAWS